jgi:transcriptional regulator with XRE-family HTH domain
MNFGEELFECRKSLAKKGVPAHQKDIANRLGVSACTISAWEKGTTFPSEQSFNKLVTIFPSLNKDEHRRLIKVKKPVINKPNPNPKKGPRGKLSSKPNRVSGSGVSKPSRISLKTFEKNLLGGKYKSATGAKRVIGRMTHWTDEARVAARSAVNRHYDPTTVPDRFAQVGQRKPRVARAKTQQQQQPLPHVPQTSTDRELLERALRRLTAVEESLFVANSKLDRLLNGANTAQPAGPAETWQSRGGGRWENISTGHMWIEEEALMNRIAEMGILNSDFHNNPYDFRKEFTPGVLSRLGAGCNVLSVRAHLPTGQKVLYQDDRPNAMFDYAQHWVHCGAPPVDETGEFDLNAAKKKLVDVMGDEKAAVEQIVRTLRAMSGLDV